MTVKQLPVLSQIIEAEQPSSHLGSQQQSQGALRGWKQWYGAIAALESLLHHWQEMQGLILSSPAPVMTHSRLKSVVLTPPSQSRQRSLRLAPVSNSSRHSLQEVRLSENDPLQKEQFCLLFTPKFSLLMVLTVREDGVSCFDFSFDPEVTEKAWLTLRSRLQSHCPQQLSTIEKIRQQFPLTAPHYQLVTEFTRQMLANLPSDSDISSKTETIPETSHSTDVELLQALTHEVRTPLTTIRMLTRLLLKRTDLSDDVIKRLRVIDQECTEQINRMELIFQATELEAKSDQDVHLTPIPLEDLFARSIPDWKKQAQRRNVELDVILPEQLPTVISNPELLRQVLTGLMENFTARLPMGGTIKVQVTTVGHQIKLQLLSQSHNGETEQKTSSQEKSIGQLLTLQPETGNLSLNLNVTKNIFQALGGKLTVRQREEVGEVLTVFLPVNVIDN